MRMVVAVGWALVVGAWTVVASAPLARANEPAWRPASRPESVPAVAATATVPPLTLGRPIPLPGADSHSSSEAAGIVPASYLSASAAAPTTSPSRPPLTLERPRPLVRAQAPDVPPPAFPGSAPPVVAAPGGEEAYNCAVAGPNRHFFGRCWDRCQEWAQGVPGAVQGIFQPGPERGIFQSDKKYDGKFISPVTNPFEFEDPRALTEVRPIFMWQRTPNDNPVFAGGDNFFGGLQARLAVTERFSIVIHKLGWVWVEPEGPGFDNHAGFSEFWIGPKFTFCRGECCAWAAGVIFEIPIGAEDVFQDTGNLSINPYFSFGCNFYRTSWGAFNFMNTTGYSFSIDSERTDRFHSSFHLSYDVLGANKFFPLVELNWAYYPFNGGARDFTFEGRDMFNFGSTQVAGKHDLTLAVGARYKFSECFQLGVAAEFNVLSGPNHLDRFRLTADMIIRY